MATKFDLDFSDFGKLEKSIRRLGALPQKCVTKAAKKGVRVVRMSIKKRTPKKEGFLRKGLKIIGEKSRKKGKKVYQVVFDRAMNDVFRKPIIEPGKYGGENPTGYYPQSVEGGFRTENGKTEGKHFMEEGAEAASSSAKKAMLETLEKEIDKEWMKA